MKTPLLPAACATLALLGGQTAAAAETQLGEYFTFYGFGTVGAVKTNSNEGQYGRDRQTGGADKSASLDVDSNLGLQLTGTATPWLSGTVQVLAAKRNKSHIEPNVEWAYAQVKPIDGLSIRLGRMALPAFAVSDSRNVGYANNWVRPPNEVYALNLFHRLEGGDITYRASHGPATVSATLIAGKTVFPTLTGAPSLDNPRARGVNLQVETEWATFRYGKIAIDVSVDSTPDRYSFSGVGVIVDRNNVVFQAESVRRRSATLPSVVDANGWYVMGGYHFGTVLPYVIVSDTKPKDMSSPAHVSGIQKTTAVGVRWDVFKSTALKFQIDRIDTKGTTGISFTTPSVPGPPGPPGLPLLAALTRPVTVLSLAVDFVF